MSSDDGWEEVFENDADIKVDTKELITKQDKVIQIVRSILEIFKNISEPFIPPIISETIDYNIKRVLTNILLNSDDLLNYENNIKFFKSLKYYGIHSRIYFVMDTKLSTFLEICINGEIIQNDKKWGGSVFYIDSNFNFDDYSWYFSRTTKHYEIFRSIIQMFKNLKSSDTSKLEPFIILDNGRLKILPTSFSKFSKHPFYVLQSQLRFNLAVFPKRPIFGYFKGEPVFSRENIIKLKTETQYYKIGKELKDKKPYKIHNNIKLYSDFQVKDIKLDDMNEKRIADYFHENHIPSKCVFIGSEYAELVCRMLNIEYRTCFRGFKRGCPIYLGVFIYKTDLLIFSNFLYEYSENIKRMLNNEIGLKAAENWRMIFKTITKYLEIRKMLGLGDVNFDDS